MPQDTYGKSAWFDLPVEHLLDAMSFYEGLLGWKYVQMSESVETDYVMIQVGKSLIGGLRRIQDGHQNKTQSCAAILYFTVDDLTLSSTRAKELGALMVGAPIDLGQGRGRYQHIRDRERNLIALWAPH